MRMSAPAKAIVCAALVAFCSPAWGKSHAQSWATWFFGRPSEPRAEARRWKDGIYRTAALGYSSDIDLTLTIDQGRIAAVSIRHEESMDLGATVYLPRRIVDLKTPSVDAVSGATVTSEAIVEAAQKACRLAGKAKQCRPRSTPVKDVFCRD